MSRKCAKTPEVCPVGVHGNEGFLFSAHCNCVLAQKKRSVSVAYLVPTVTVSEEDEECGRGLFSAHYKLFPSLRGNDGCRRAFLQTVTQHCSPHQRGNSINVR